MPFVPMLAPPELDEVERERVIRTGIAPDGWGHVDSLSRRYHIPEALLMRCSTKYRPLASVEFGEQTPLTRWYIGGYILMSEHQVAVIASMQKRKVVAA